jgi:ribonuclease T2
MRSIVQSALLSAALVTAAGSSSNSRCEDVLSCSANASSQSVDSCCVPKPAGLFIFRQRFEPDVGSDMGSWGIDGLDVLESVDP